MGRRLRRRSLLASQSQVGVFLGIVAVALIGWSGPLRAATIDSITTSFGPLHTPDSLDDVGPDRSQTESDLTLLGSRSDSFSFRFTANASVDAEAGGDNATIVLQADYTIQLAIGAAVGEAWEIVVYNGRRGALTLVDDGAGRAVAQLMASQVAVTGATLVGSLDLAAVGILSGAGGGDLAFAQGAVGSLTGTGPSLVTVQFTTAMRVQTRRAAGEGDEAAVRMGIPSALSSFSAGSYPGVPLRAISGDGHFIGAALVPEPGAFLTLSLGLLGLAVFGRRRDGTRGRPAPVIAPAPPITGG